MRGNRAEVLSLFEEILRDGTGLRVRVTGGSMLPFLKDGEVLTIRQVPGPSLCIGDLILFKGVSDATVLHRILRKRKHRDGTLSFLTKGDALPATDGEVHQRCVLGKVCEIRRPDRSGVLRSVDLNSRSRKHVNYFIAVLGRLKARA